MLGPNLKVGKMKKRERSTKPASENEFPFVPSPSDPPEEEMSYTHFLRWIEELPPEKRKAIQDNIFVGDVVTGVLPPKK